MYSFNIFSVISLTAANTYLLIALYILFKNLKSSANRLFAMVGITMAIWGLGEGMMRASTDPKTALFWATYVVGIGSALHPPFLLHFWLVFTRKVTIIKNKLLIIAFYVPGIIFIILRFSNPAILVKSVAHEYWGYSTVGTPLYLLYMLFIVSYTAIVVYMAFRIAAEMHGNLKKQARYIGFAILICLVIGFITQASQPVLHLSLPELTVTSTILFISVIAYTVNKYGFLVITTGLVAENIIAIMEDFVVVIDNDMKMAIVNNAVLSKLGYEKTELLGKPLNLLLSADISSLPHDQFIKRLPLSNYQMLLIAKNGNWIPVSANISILKGESNDPTGFVFVLRDMRKVNELISNLEKTKIAVEHSLVNATSLQEVIKEERDRAKAIVSSVGEGLVVLGKDLKIVLINPVAEKLLEISSQDAIGRNIKDITKVFKNGQELAEADRPAAKTLAGASINITVEDNCLFKLMSGKEFPVSLTTTPLKGNGITGVIEVFRDISLEKQSRALIEQQVVARTKELQTKNIALTAAKEEISRGWLQIQMEKARLLASVNSITLGFLMIDVNGKTMIKNPAVERTIGAKSEYADINSIDQLLGPVINLKENFNKCINERAPVDLKDMSFNNRFFHLFMAPIFSTDVALTIIGVVILIQDETEAKVLERSRDEFFSIASHELRTPLTAIRGNTSLMEQFYGEKLAAEPELKEMVDDIHASSLRLIQIVNDFLNVSRLEQSRMEYKIENFDLPELINKKIKEMESLSLEKNILIKLEKPTATIPNAYGDKDRVGEVLLNLFGNALKYSDKGNVSVQISLLQGFLKVSVTDTGKGIPPEQQSLLFRKFQQAGNSILTRDTTRATGLGLYISKLMVEQMGGQIFLEKSVPNVGSTFSFTIPIQRASQEKQSPVNASVNAISG